MSVENSSAIDEIKQLLKRGDIDLNEYTRRVLAHTLLANPLTLRRHLF